MIGKTNSSVGGEVISADFMIMPKHELQMLESIKQYNALPDNIGKSREHCFWLIHHPMITTYSMFVTYILSLKNEDTGIRLYSSVDAYCYSFTDGMLGYDEFISTANRYNNQSRIKYNVDLGVTTKLMFTRYIPAGVSVTDDVNMVSNTVAVDISCNLGGGVLTYYSDDYSTIYISAKSGNYLSRVICPSNLESEYFDFYTDGDTTTPHSMKELDFNNSFNTSRVSEMPWFAGKTEYWRINVLGLDTSNVQIWTSMFNGCSGLRLLDGLAYLDTSNAVNMWNMFDGCTSLSEVDVSGFNTEKVAYMTRMFRNCTSLTEIDISNFDITNVVDIDYLFYNCTGLESIIMPEERVLSPKYGDVTHMFEGCSSLKGLDLSSFNTSGVGNTEYMFENCFSLVWIVLTGFNTSRVTSMKGMFRNCSSLLSLDLSSFNTSSVNNMAQMFQGCSSLELIDVSSFNTAGVASGVYDHGMSYMFDGCGNLTTLNLSNFDISSVPVFRHMFRNCSLLSSVSFNSSSYTYGALSYTAMFEGCSSLTSLYLPTFLSGHPLGVGISKGGMFKGTTSLGIVYVARGIWDISTNSADPNMFENSAGHMEYII